MKNLICLLPFILLASCAKKEPVSEYSHVRPVAVATPAKEVNLKPVERKLDETQDSVREALASVSRVEDQLEETQNKAVEAVRQSEVAFTEGLIAGSAEADMLKQVVQAVEEDLKTFTMENRFLKTNLSETQGDLKDTQDTLWTIQAKVTSMQVQNEALYGEAVAAQKQAEGFAQQLKGSSDGLLLEKAAHNRTKKNRRTWLTVAVLLLIINVTYVAGHMNGWSLFR